jgi:hypothetical protein
MTFKRISYVLAAVALVSTAAATAPADAVQAKNPTPARYPQVAAKPYLGWSS